MLFSYLMSNIESEKKLECHKCWVEMKKEEIDTFGPNIIIDICPQCYGIWLDKGELNKLLKDRNLSNYLTKHIGTKSRSPMICPRCAMTMDFEMAEGIEVDVCMTCGGIWLDAGELDLLKQKSAEGFEGDPQVKAKELEEERRYHWRTSPIHRFFYKISGKDYSEKKKKADK